jgi:hypothetical protein
MRERAGAGLRTVLLAALSATLGFGGARALAGNLDYQVTAGYAHSDNLTRVDTNEQDGDIGSAGFKFSFDEKTRKLTADLVGNFDYQKYLDDTYDDDLIGSFVGDVTLAFVPERFNWVIGDNFGQVLADPLLPSTPANSENINYFTTGPDVTMAFGSKNRLRVGARYLRTDYEDSPYDSDGYLGEIGFGRDLSRVNSLSLNARFQQQTFDQTTLGADYDQSEAFVRYEGNGARTQVKLDAGYAELDRDVAEDSSSELLRLSVLRQLTLASNLTLLAGREFANTGAAFATFQGEGPITLDPNAGRQTPEPFLHDYLSLAWYFQRNRTTFSLRAGIDKQDYELADALDQKLTHYGATFRRDLSAVTDIQLDAGQTQGEFTLGGAEYTDTLAGLAFNWGLSRTLFLSLSYRYAHRAGDPLTGEYTENRLWLSIGYRHGSPRNAALRPDFGADAPAN